ncbi:EF-P beta-lysylation protein EpmB [Vibrio tapetis]|uniref:L-lysine 2,3-aminomutase n=1 Tax=Vibrio tapetis subsp. tapetis TaxID=1671868 RepID=A0A2N8ZFX5_9VIBR|nr:EF-P beta-lysylation protein EpmB [Vibrio tapetis]SON50800.1 putative lysine aminomutase [Vibrio tapetis subsp. tapetis]
MPHIITRIEPSVEQNWLKQLANAISDPSELLSLLEIDPIPWQKGFAARELFPMRVPMSFVDRMEKGNPNDPLLKQVLPLFEEYEQTPGYSADPLDEQNNQQPGLLHKYKNRVLLIVKGGCAINCRYCFRRHFPYADNKGSKSVWLNSLEYIKQHTELNEVILSGGDPLMAKDNELEWLINNIADIKHIKTLRIHTRLPVVIPARITNELCQILTNTRLNIVFVTHINHGNEIDNELTVALNRLKSSGCTLLNQAVLLKGINDSAEDQIMLSETLFSAGVLPYYLYVLDKVQGAAHYFVSDARAKEIMADVITQVSGYLVPRLTREIGGRASKTPINLDLE